MGEEQIVLADHKSDVIRGSGWGVVGSGRRGGGFPEYVTSFGYGHVEAANAACRLRAPPGLRAPGAMEGSMAGPRRDWGDGRARALPALCPWPRRGASCFAGDPRTGLNRLRNQPERFERFGKLVGKVGWVPKFASQNLRSKPTPSKFAPCKNGKNSKLGPRMRCLCIKSHLSKF